MTPAEREDFVSALRGYDPFSALPVDPLSPIVDALCRGEDRTGILRLLEGAIDPDLPGSYAAWAVAETLSRAAGNGAGLSDAVALLGRLLSNRQQGARIHAAEALLRLAEQDDLSPIRAELERALGDPDPQVREAAQRVCLRMGG